MAAFVELVVNRPNAKPEIFNVTFVPTCGLEDMLQIDNGPGATPCAS